VELQLLSKKVGEDNESLYYIGYEKMEQPEILNFALIQLKCWNAPYWVEDNGSYWMNHAGGRIPKSSSDKILERVAIDGDFEALDWTKTDLINPNSEAGWLSPEGKFYGCEWMKHDLIARYILKKKVEYLMNTNWVRIQDKNNYVCYKELTQSQIDWMYQHGYDFKKWCY
jgi:hypothetical protein